MAWKLLKTETMPMGIDLGTTMLRLAQLRQAQGRLELVEAASAEVPATCRDAGPNRTAFCTERLRRLVRGGAFKGRRCVITLPASVTHIQHVKTAKMPAAELEKALRWELEGKLPFDAATAVLRYVVAGETYAERDSGLEVIAVAASRETVEAHLELARQCRLEVSALNVEPCAILECFVRLLRRNEDAQRVSMFLDLGWASTQVVIVHGARMVFARNVNFGARQIDQAIGSALSLAPEEVEAARVRLSSLNEAAPEAEGIYAAMGGALETMVEEVTKCLRYYESVFPSNPVERGIFLGGQAGDRGLCQRIAQRLNLPAQIGDPLARVARPVPVQAAGLDRRAAQPAWAVAVGSSLATSASQAA